MTHERFSALATLAGARGGPVTDAARSVLVDGLRQADAARLHSVSRQALSNALARLARVNALVITASG